MFKSARWRSEKNKIKTVFKFQFQATQVLKSSIFGIWILISHVRAVYGNAVKNCTLLNAKWFKVVRGDQGSTRIFWFFVLLDSLDTPGWMGDGHDNLGSCGCWKTDRENREGCGDRWNLSVGKPNLWNREISPWSENWKDQREGLPLPRLDDGMKGSFNFCTEFFPLSPSTYGLAGIDQSWSPWRSRHWSGRLCRGV